MSLGITNEYTRKTLLLKHVSWKKQIHRFTQREYNKPVGFNRRTKHFQLVNIFNLKAHISERHTSKTLANVVCVVSI